MVDNCLVKVDRMSMAASLETRVPLLDHKIVEFIFRLPGDLKLRGMTTKWIFKKTMERLLPRENIYRRKEGFSIPIKSWLAGVLRPLMEELLSPARLAEFNVRTLAGYLDEIDVIRRMRLHGRRVRLRFVRRG